MLSRRFLLILGAVLAIIGLLAWLTGLPLGGPTPVTASGGLAPARFRLGLIPERNLYEQRKAFRMLADYLETHVQISRGASTLDSGPALRVELVTSSNYAGILKDFASGEIDGAFLGSLVTVLAVDRSGAEVLAKSVNLDKKDTYAGVVFTLPTSGIGALAELHGRRLGAVRTTMAGSIYPRFALGQAGIGDDALPEWVWCGTHDDVIEEVVAGRVDAGAVKDLRLDAYERAHPGVIFRRLATGPRVPDSAFVVSRSLTPDVRQGIVAALLAMEADPHAKLTLEGLQTSRFERCDISEYGPLYDMIEALGPKWQATGVESAAPKRPAGAARRGN